MFSFLFPVPSFWFPFHFISISCFSICPFNTTQMKTAVLVAHQSSAQSVRSWLALQAHRQGGFKGVRLNKPLASNFIHDPAIHFKCTTLVGSQLASLPLRIPLSKRVWFQLCTSWRTSWWIQTPVFSAYYFTIHHPTRCSANCSTFFHGNLMSAGLANACIWTLNNWMQSL